MMIMSVFRKVQSLSFGDFRFFQIEVIDPAVNAWTFLDGLILKHHKLKFNKNNLK